MLRILNVKTDAVTRGVESRNVQVMHDLTEVTFMDNGGTPHTIYYHKEGPVQSPEDAVSAWERGELHDTAEPIEPPAEPLAPAGPVFDQGTNPPRNI